MPKDDTHLITAHDVARHAGVSRSAVSRTFTPGASVSPHTRDKVMAAAQALGYQVNLIARTMNKGYSNFVGVVTAGFESPFRASLLSPITVALNRQGLMPLLMNADDPLQLEQSLHELLSYQIAGVILTSASPPLSVVQHYLKHQIPVAMINRGHELEGAEVIGSDNRGGGRLAADTLLAGGASAWLLSVRAHTTSVAGNAGKAFATGSPKSASAQWRCWMPHPAMTAGSAQSNNCSAPLNGPMHCFVQPTCWPWARWTGCASSCSCPFPTMYKS
jgi:Transcriptional regulators